MLKVFLVEDEIVMREGIKNNIDWEKEGFEFAGEASDGELAYPLIQKEKPDILIADIKMPFMDGLELSRLVRQELPDIKVIILSGYDEFEYAKEAISIGITDYLVKPIAGAKLLEAVKKVGKIIEEEQQQRLFLKTFEKERLENIHLAKQKIFRSLASGKKPVSELLKDAREAGVDLAANRYNIVLLQIFEEGETVGYSEKQNAAAQDIEEMTEHMPGVLMVELGIEGWAFIIKETDTERSLEQILPDFLEKLQEIIRGYEGIEYFGGVGRAVCRLSELNRCFEEANRAFSYRYLINRNQIIYSEEEANGSFAGGRLKASSLNVINMDREIVERFLKTGLKSEVRHFIDEYFESVGESGIRSFLLRQYVTMDMFFTTVAMLRQIGYDSEDLMERCGDFQAMTSVFSSVEQTKSYLQGVFEAALDLRDTVSQKKYSSLLKNARTYIEQNYDNEEISLNTVAASVNLSPNHFSTIFNQETGQTFIEFLTHVRMEKAKELLRGTSMRMSEIAYTVGYKDAHYFSYLFKKTQECTPREFRSQG